ncbi:hypothetical protein PoMZ_00113 [Pyricularia oryzae]|uniref:Uncharacterized protein n=1 Tax=Pyricularia oryzae TaxID=318829 RepID=A0A4P7MYV6_PYROR|nr:hypothetical protein PoMZ_00113 [Pyricularia oryzae]
MNAVSSSPIWDSSPTIAKSAVRHGKESLTKPRDVQPGNGRVPSIDTHLRLPWPVGEVSRTECTLPYLLTAEKITRNRLSSPENFNALRHARTKCSHCVEYDVICKAGDKIEAMITFLENQKALSRIASHGVALNDLHVAPGGTHASSVVQLIGCRSCW